MTSTPGYTILEYRQTYRLIDGGWYRDAIARRHADGALRAVSVITEPSR